MNETRKKTTVTFVLYVYVYSLDDYFLESLYLCSFDPSICVMCI